MVQVLRVTELDLQQVCENSSIITFYCAIPILDLGSYLTISWVQNIVKSYFTWL